MQIVRVIPQLRTTNLVAAIEFYTAKLGFTLEFQYRRLLRQRAIGASGGAPQADRRSGSVDRVRRSRGALPPVSRRSGYRCCGRGVEAQRRAARAGRPRNRLAHARVRYQGYRRTHAVLRTAVVSYNATAGSRCASQCRSRQGLEESGETAFRVTRRWVGRATLLAAPVPDRCAARGGSAQQCAASATSVSSAAALRTSADRPG